jgi:peptidylprolyl isomerase
MTAVKQGDTVRVHYTGRLEDGTVFDSSVERDPLEFTIGEGQIIPGFEGAVVGMEAGDSKTVLIDSTNAYGPHFEELVQVVDRDQIPGDIELEVGVQLQANHPQGGPLILTITDFCETTVTLDANHPLAGKDLTFEIEVLSVG